MVNTRPLSRSPGTLGAGPTGASKPGEEWNTPGLNLAQAWPVLTGREDRPEREQLLADARAGASLRLHHTVLRARWGGAIVDRGDWRSQKNVGRRLAQQDQTSLP